MADTQLNAYKIELSEAEKTLVEVKAHIADLKAYIKDNESIEAEEVEEAKEEEVSEAPKEKKLWQKK